MTLYSTASPDVHSRRTMVRCQLTVSPAGTAGKLCVWPSIEITMSSADGEQFFAEPVTVIGVPGQAFGGLHSALASTHGGFLHVTERSAVLVTPFWSQSFVAFATTAKGTSSPDAQA